MVSLRELRSERINSTKPIARVVDKGDDFKIIGIAISKGETLDEHKTPFESRLFIVEGIVEYREENRAFTLHHYDEFVIQPNVMHSLVAKEDCLCLLIQKK